MKKKRVKNKTDIKAFTLAEILTALTIIGVIAAVTVPALMQRTQKQEYVSALQKAYSTLSQAAHMIIAEHGSPKADENSESRLSDDISVYNMYKKYLNVIKDCGTSEGCISRQMRDLNQSYYSDNWGTMHLPGVVFNDGVQAGFFGADKTCRAKIEGFGAIDYCARIYVDLNGEKKPNTIGIDIFQFVLKENGLFPQGCGYEHLCSRKTGGLACACKVLKEGKMDY